MLDKKLLERQNKTMPQKRKDVQKKTLKTSLTPQQVIHRLNRWINALARAKRNGKLDSF